MLRCYDWATDVAGTVGAVVSGFHADIERDVLRLLLQQEQPVIMVLARALYKELPTELHAPLDAGRLLCRLHGRYVWGGVLRSTEMST